MNRQNNLWHVVYSTLCEAKVARHEDGGLCPSDAGDIARRIESRYDVPTFGPHLDDMGAECLIGNIMIEHRRRRDRSFWWKRFVRPEQCECGWTGNEVFEYHQAQEVMAAIRRHWSESVLREMSR